MSDIPANKAVHLDEKCYFACGDSQALATLLTTAVDQPLVCYAEYLKKYDWNLIAKQTYDVFLAAENDK